MQHTRHLLLVALLLLFAVVASVADEMGDHCENMDTSSGSCNHCEESYTNFNGICVMDCDEWNCVLCKQSQSICTHCDIFYHLEGTKCVKDCEDEQCSACPDDRKQCKSCKVGFKDNGQGKCVLDKPCKDPNCGDCETKDGKEVCKWCIGLYVLRDGTCAQNCRDPYCQFCLSKRSQCDQCIPGFTLKDNRCSPDCTDILCRECSANKNVCTKCADGYVPDNTGKCKLNTGCPDKYCLKCDEEGKQHCAQCVEGYYLLNGKCTILCSVDKCAVCKHNDPNNCDMCLPTHQLVNGKCDAKVSTCSVPFCKTCVPGQTDQCQDCAEGYTKNNGKCDAEVSSCSVPSCKTCVPGRTDQCQDCAEGYTKNNGKCDAEGGSCSVPFCKTCVSGHTDQCQDCAEGYTMNTTKQCVQSCNVANCDVCVFGKADKCHKCQAGYTVKNRVCTQDEACPVDFCVNCDGGKKCSGCEAGYSRTSNGTCTLPCEVVHCNVCQDGRSDVCKTCDATHTEKDGKCVGKDGAASPRPFASAALAVLAAAAVALWH